MKKINSFGKIGISKYAVGAALGFSLLLPLMAMAYTIDNPPQYGIIQSPSDISKIINATFIWLGGIILTISLIMFFYAAILYMTAGASETVHGKAKTVLIYAVVGLAIAILTFSFRPFLQTFFGGQF